jgi:hypothetical protein
MAGPTFETKRQKAPLTTKYGFLNPSIRIHGLTWMLAIIAILFSLVYVIVATKRYSTELTIPGFLGGSHVGMKRFEDEYLSELSRYLADQVKDELKDQVKRDMQGMHEQVKDSLDEVMKEAKDMKQAVQDSIHDYHRRLEEETKQQHVIRQEVKRAGVNYASVYSGCEIYDHSPTHTFNEEIYRIGFLPIAHHQRDPNIIITHNSEKPTPGLCWPFKGGEGFIILQLREPVKISEVIYAHVEKSEEPDHLIKSAPRSIEVWGGIDLKEFKFLGETELVRDGNSNAQILVEEPRMAKYIKIKISDNYGADFTCLYRVYVYAISANLD